MKAYLFPYEKLHAWQNARKLIKEVYGLTEKLPNQEKFGLVSQINRAAISIASNLAEGSARTSFKDQAHFSQLAYSSLMEVSCQLIIASDLGYLKKEEMLSLNEDIQGLANQINSLRNSQLSRI